MASDRKRRRILSDLKTLFDAEEVLVDFDRAMSHIKKYKQLVWDSLKSYPPGRDSDLYLYYNVLEAMGANPKSMSVHDLLAGIAQDLYPNYDSITRLRRAVQEVDEATRGPNYKPRASTEEQIQKEIDEITRKESAGAQVS